MDSNVRGNRLLHMLLGKLASLFARKTLQLGSNTIFLAAAVTNNEGQKKETEFVHSFSA